MVTLNVIAAPNMIMPQGGLVAGIYQAPTPARMQGSYPPWSFPPQEGRDVY
jgi:hypothetical protein